MAVNGELHCAIAPCCILVDKQIIISGYQVVVSGKTFVIKKEGFF